MAKKGYWNVSYISVADGSVLPEYAKLAKPAIDAGGGRLVFRGNPAKTYEAGVNAVTVLVEFESLEKAIATYESAAYQAAVKALKDGVKRDVRIMEGE
jgi:uncharacterized protein (DUF1330 family)